MTTMPPAPYTMRAPCKKCGGTAGVIRERGAQDCVFCLGCDAFQYNAPRVETGKAVRSVSTVHAAIKPAQRARILIRANCSCEFCGKRIAGTRAELHVAHFLSVDNGLPHGLTEVELNSDENLFAACDECNLGLGKETVPLWLVVNILMARLRRGRGPTP